MRWGWGAKAGREWSWLVVRGLRRLDAGCVGRWGAEDERRGKTFNYGDAAGEPIVAWTARGRLT